MNNEVTRTVLRVLNACLDADRQVIRNMLNTPYGCDKMLSRLLGSQDCAHALDLLNKIVADLGGDRIVFVRNGKSAKKEFMSWTDWIDMDRK